MNETYHFPTNKEIKKRQTYMGLPFFLYLRPVKLIFLEKMKKILVLCGALVACVALSSFSLKGKEKKVYLFGMAASFNDSVAYCTTVQVVDSVELVKGLLPQREAYAYQMKSFIEAVMGKENFTCMIYFSENKAKLEKEAAKVMNKYTKSNTLKALADEEFAFHKPADEP